MAKFNSGNIPTEEVSANNRPFKPQGNSALQARIAFEKFNQPVDTNPAPGPNVFRNTLSPKPAVGAKPLQEDKTDNDPKLPFKKPNSALHKYGSSIRSAQTEADGKAGFSKSLGLKPTELQKEDSKPFSKSPVHKPFLCSGAQENEYKPAGPKPSFLAAQQENEVKSAFPRPSEARAAFIAASRKTEPQTQFPKKPILEQKPSVPTHALSNDDNSSKTSPAPKGPTVLRATKPAINSPKPTVGNLENNNGLDSSVQGFPAVTLKPTIRSVQSPFLNQNTEENNNVPKPNIARNVFRSKESVTAASFSTPKFQKPNLTSPGGGSQEKEEGQKDSSMPKRKTLPSLSAIGPAPQKSPRPPNVDLERFKKNTKGDSLNKGLLNKPTPPPTLHSSVPPPPPVSHPSMQTPLPPLPAVHTPTHPPVPSLPPRNIKPPTESLAPDGENYDDVEFDSSLEGNQAHGISDESEESDQEHMKGSMTIRSPSRKELEIRKEKEEKKRQELEKKEQKEKEKREQEIRKRFKLVGPIEILHHARACIDYKGGKNELSVKQGEEIEIIRITDNPEGKWLGRVKDSYGYIKTTLVEIDYDSLRSKKPSFKQEENDQEVYDDVGEQDSINRTVGGNESGSGTFFPPPPSDDEIYDGIDEDNVSSVQQEEEKPSTWAWGLFKMITGKDDKKKPVEEKRVKEDEEEDITGSFTHLSHADAEEVYDDVEDFPPPPKNLSLGINMKSLSLGRGKGEDKDVKKFKRMEKEEKDFRKKFKYDGEVRVLYSAQVNALLIAKKWGAKDLPLKPGESLEVIQDTDDTKVLCRNDEGKYGYVLRSNLMGKDGDIYDDIGDDCIYDND
ncbi:FYN-binding protein 1 isoform X1 [Microcaecilia unicolor]|nr:FYN-binding protein 1 isoform X1 [Microcaecilia unicolor]XP_030048926.1 FYN-binding protein 1 isoform X1 [Microcaecilia unicolor]XP_030048927.1 FYN-binding protein 1 isoform X1 [Microcaecilia unicolor]